LKLRRTLIGMSQERLGELLDVTFQQIQKYERGANRIGSSRLYELARALDVPVGFFFDGLAPGRAAPTMPGLAPGLAEEGAAWDADGADTQPDNLGGRETLEMVRAFQRIDDAAVRKRVLDLVRTLGRAEGAD
jgi:transcriptional regulator with XRE-family HTH domain